MKLSVVARLMWCLTPLAAAGFGFSGELAGATWDQRPQDVPLIFRPFYEGPIFPDDRLKAARAALPYDRIALELSGGMLIPGGHFRLTLHRDGEASLSSAGGGSRFGTAGDFEGTVNYLDFGKLSHLVAGSGLDGESRRYRSNWSDM